MSATATEVARKLEAGFRAGPAAAPQAIGRLCGDQVEYRHIPALPSDGVVDGTRLAEGTGREAAAIGRALSDQRYTDIEVTVDGTEVRVVANLLGVLATGAAVCLPTQMRCIIDDGRIVAITHVMDGGAMKAWAEVAAAAGMAAAKRILDDSASE
ncbi:MAG: nuclear transport factor 2-like protein [Acidimicrobiales bacterium]